MMLEFLGHKDAHDGILAAIEKVLSPEAVRRARRTWAAKPGRPISARPSPRRCPRPETAIKGFLSSMKITHHAYD
jgi:hypothetical protein